MSDSRLRVKFYKAHEKGVFWSSDDAQEAKHNELKLSFFKLIIK